MHLTCCYFQKDITLIFFILVSIILFFPSSINAQPIIDKKIPEKGYYILTLPSGDCINCKAMGIDIINNIQKNNLLDSLVIVTGDDAGAYYLSNNEITFGKFKNIIDNSLCKKLAPTGKSTISYKYGDSIKSVNLIYGLDSLLSLVNSSGDKYALSEISPDLVDSIYLKYNIFNSYGNYILKDDSNNLFLFSKQSNAGCYLFSKQSSDTVSLLKTFLSITKYDSLFQEFNCAQFANIQQKTMREILSNIGIPISKIYNITSVGNKLYLLYYFFTGTADTTIEDSTRHINQRLIYNIYVSHNDKNIENNPLNLSLYKAVLKIDDTISFENSAYKNVSYAEFNVIDDYIYLPMVKIASNHSTIDSLYYLAQYSLNATIVQKPIKMLYYPSGNFSENCMLRSFEHNNPILVNKITKKMDFGEGIKPIKYDSILLTSLGNDNIDILYDIFPINENDVKVIASTKMGRLITAHLINKSKFEHIETLTINEIPIYCQFMQEKKVIAISKKEHILYSMQYDLL